MTHPLTAEMIAEAKKRTRYGGRTMVFGADYTPHHEHDDCIRIAYEWLDAQKKLARPNPRIWGEPVKHLIERWAGRYVSQDDVAVAAELHPEIKGLYPRYSIASKLTLPSQERLAAIDEAGRQPYYYQSFDDKDYGAREEPSGQFYPSPNFSRNFGFCLKPWETEAFCNSGFWEFCRSVYTYTGAGRAG